MPGIEAVHRAREQLLAELRQKDTPYQVAVEGVEVTIFPGVFPPRTDTHLLARHLHCAAGESLLELTTGSGALSVLAGKRGAHGLAVDINPSAVNNANHNFLLHRVGFDAQQSDLFTNVRAERFDWIVANPPYHDGEVTDPLEHGCYGWRRFVIELTARVHDFLNPKGKMLITCPEWGETSWFEEELTRSGFEWNIAGKHCSDDGARVYRLYDCAG